MAYTPLYSKRDLEDLIKHIKFITGELSLEELYGKPLEKVQEEAARAYYAPPRSAAAPRRSAGTAQRLKRGALSFTSGFFSGMAEFLSRSLFTHPISPLAEPFLPEKFKPERHVRRIVEEAKKKTPSKEAFEIGREMGRMALPTAAGATVAAPFEAGVAALTRGIPIVQRAAPWLVRTLVEAPTAITLERAATPKEERKPLTAREMGEEILYWGASDLLFRGIGRALRILGRSAKKAVKLTDKELRARLSEIRKVPVGAEAPEAAVKTAALALPPPKEVRALPAPRPERHAEPRPSTGTVKWPKPKRSPTLAERLQKASPSRRKLALGIIEDYVTEDPGVTAEAREALSLWKTFKTNPEALDDAARSAAARMDAQLGHPVNEVDFLRRYRERVRHAVLYGTRELPRYHRDPRAQLEHIRKFRAGEIDEIPWGHGDLLEAVLTVKDQKLIRDLLKAVEAEEEAQARMAESILRDLIERRRATQPVELPELAVREAAEAAVEHAEAPSRQWPVLEEPEAVPGAPGVTEAPHTAPFAEAAIERTEVPRGEAATETTPAAPQAPLPSGEQLLFAEWERVRTGAVPVEQAHPALQRLREEYETLKGQLSSLPPGEARAAVEQQVRRYETDPEYVKERVGALLDEARKNGEEIYCGLHPRAIAQSAQAVWDSLKRMFRSRNAGATFRPIEAVDGIRKSLPQDYFELLPDVKVEIDGKEKFLKQWLVEIDEAAARLNQRRHELELAHGPRQSMPPQAKAEYDKLAEQLRKLDEKREKLRPVVEEALGLARRGQYSKSLAARIDRAKVPPWATETLQDAQGNVVGYVYRTPRGEELRFVTVGKELTVKDIQRLGKFPIGEAVIGQCLARDMFGEAVVRPFRNAYFAMQKFINDYETELAKILKPVLGKEESLERITLLLEGQQVVTATPVEREVARKLRDWYDRLFREFGLDADRYLKDYAPRIRQAGSVRAAFGSRPPAELQFFAAMERVAEVPVFPRELNAYTAALTYLRQGARWRFLGPVIEEMASLREFMHPVRRWVYDQWVKWLLGRPVLDEELAHGVIEQAIKAVYKEVPPWARKRVLNYLSHLQTHLGYLGTMAGNPMSVLKNSLQTLVSVFTLDPTPGTGVIKGLQYFARARKALLTEEGRELLKYSWVYTMREEVFLEGLERRLAILGAELPGLAGKAVPALGRLVKLVEDVGFWPFGKVEKFNAANAYMMRLLYELDRGRPLAEAIELANEFAADTQFLYGPDSPILWKGPLGRIAGMLMSYPVNFARLLVKLGNRKDAGRLINLFLGGTAAATALTYLTGLDFTTETPAAVVTQHPTVALLRRQFTGESGAETTSVAVQLYAKTARAIPAGYRLLTGQGTEEDEKAVQDFLRVLSYHTPFGVVVGRALKVAKSIRQGMEVTDEESKLTYRYGEVEVPGEGTRTGYHPIPEYLRALVGRTREQAERQRYHRLIEQEEARYQYLRDQAFRAWLRGDLVEFERLQNDILSMGGNPLTMEDINRRLQEMEKTAIERQAEGLPEGYTPQEDAYAILRRLLGLEAS